MFGLLNAVQVCPAPLQRVTAEQQFDGLRASRGIWNPSRSMPWAHEAVSPDGRAQATICDVDE
ncbi:BQ5605_C013g07068 [Microbotryum silenes-dioicae]|uniref:BQ5605_C013g07068 protein n=1 Tax=Microbotryum silenes-dioicae TaxID=796604 RepID=A0A2X0NUY2_9BASI|nr:BQ5605_C013g07068 [Microbotryum silenes-dioicae]